ncbi:hypothetical protein HYV64_05585 [Candidatus Shapirobacteria bacterium]|nr:hypothetical protein [Candidatus Shapirobacteria bacterium]
MKGDQKLVFFSIILLTASFFGGYYLSTISTTTTNPSNAVVFTPQKSQKPELKFFIMSFCPYGNQIEDVIRPVYDLLGNDASFVPHYIFDKIDNLETFCKSRSGDEKLCDQYVQNKYFASVTDCKKTIGQGYTKCLDEKSYIKSASGILYSSLHGRQEGNQNVRELCAWNLSGDSKKAWWDFVGLVNKNCTADNADTCWEQQGKQAGLDTNKITECFNKEAFNLIEKEIEITTKYQIKGSPTVLINDVDFPAESAYSQDGTGSMLIGKKLATQDKYRTPNVIKEAVCISFNKTPSECKTVLNELSGAAPSAGGCVN